MVFYYDKWYKLYGIRLSQQLANPPIQDINTLEFPKDSMVHYAVLDDTPIYPTRNTPPFKLAPKDTIVTTIAEYDNEENKVGKFTKASTTINEIIRNSATKEPTFTFLKPGQVITKGQNALYINNYSCLNLRYKYPVNLMRRVNMYLNNINTVVDHLQDKKDRHIFVVIPLPKILPSRVNLHRFATELKPMYLNKLPNYKYFNLLEIWKLLSPELREKSVWNRLSSDLEACKNINLIFNIDNKYICITLFRLLAMVREYDIESDIMTYKADIVKKALYLSFYSMGQSTSMETLKAISLKISKNTKITEDEKRNPNDIDLEDELDGAYEDDVIEDDDDEYYDKDLGETISKRSSVALNDEDVEIEEFQSDTSDLMDEEFRDEISGLDDDGIGDENISLEKSLSVTERDLNSIEEVYNNNIKYDGVEAKIDALLENKVITRKQYNGLKETLDNQKFEPNLYGNGKPLGDILDETQDDYTIKPDLAKVTDTPIVLDKTANTITTQAIQKDYIRNQYKKDIIRTIYSLQNSSSIVTAHRTELRETVTGKLETHEIDLKTLNGKTTTLSIVLPHIEEDGTFEYSKSKYMLRTQRTDLPIRKINRDEVCLSSAYSKLFVRRGYLQAYDKSSFIFNQISKRQGNDIDGLISGNQDFMGVELPPVYTMFGKNIKGFKYKDYVFSFDYDKRYTVLGNKSEEEINELDKKFTSDNVVIIGKKGNDILVLDDIDRVFIYKNNQYIEQDDLLTILGINYSDLPLEYTSIKIMKSNIPIGVLLAFYLGFSNLLDLLEVEYELLEPNKRPTMDKENYILRFKDRKIAVAKDNGASDLILGGMAYCNKVFKEIPSIAFEDRSMFNIVWTRLDVNLNTLNEIKLIETMFIDPVTLTVLKEMKEPITFKGLLFRANEMLTNDYYENPNDIKGSILKGYERISTILYKELVLAIRQHENRAHFSRSKISIAPHQVLNKIQEDSSVVALDNLNPMAMIKQSEDTTQLGQGGRAKLTMSKDTRNMDSTEIGIISEATKDSGDVGITAFLTANPKLTSTRGTIGELDLDKDGWSSIVSSSAMIAPFGLSDDTKRFKDRSL